MEFSGERISENGLKHMSKRITVLLWLLTSVLTLPVYGQWIGPDQRILSNKEIAQNLSPDFVVHVRSFLEALDRAGADTDDFNTWTASNKHMSNSMLVIAISAQRNIDHLYMINLFRLFKISLLDRSYRSISESEKKLHAAQPTKKLNLKPDRSTDSGYIRLLDSMVEECRKDLKVRLEGKTNPKCQAAADQLYSVFPERWFDLPEIMDISETTSPQLSEAFRRQMSVVLDKIDDVIIEIADGDLDSDHGLLKIDEIGETEPKSSNKDELLYSLNLDIRLDTLRLDVHKVMLDRAALGRANMEDFLSLGADQFCINDIRQRMNGKSDSRCDSMTQLLAPDSTQHSKVVN